MFATFFALARIDCVRMIHCIRLNSHLNWVPLVSLQNDCYWQAERLRSNDSLRSTEFASELVAARLTAERLLLAALLLTKKSVRLRVSRSSCVLLLELARTTSTIVPCNLRHCALHAAAK